MEAKLLRLTHKIAIQLHLVAESCTICSSRSRRPVRKLLGTPSYNPMMVFSKHGNEPWASTEAGHLLSKILCQEVTLDVRICTALIHRIFNWLSCV
jgi:hypothetical protein